MLRCSDKQNLWSILTINNIGIVPELGICAKRGLKKVQTKKHMPHTKVASPVFAPSFNPTPVSGERIIGGPKNRNKSLGEDVINRKSKHFSEKSVSGKRVSVKRLFEKIITCI